MTELRKKNQVGCYDTLNMEVHHLFSKRKRGFQRGLRAFMFQVAPELVVWIWIKGKFELSILTNPTPQLVASSATSHGNFGFCRPDLDGLVPDFLSRSLRRAEGPTEKAPKGRRAQNNTPRSGRKGSGNGKSASSLRARERARLGVGGGSKRLAGSPSFPSWGRRRF